MPVLVVPYDPAWPAGFDALRARIWPVVADVAVTIEHVGSTSVPGLAAKPIIDLDVIVGSAAGVPIAIERLARLGYVHQGDLGVTGREAFVTPEGSVDHHLYVCVAGGSALRNHLALRDHLRTHPADAAEYGAVKLRIGPEAADIDAYVAAKTDLIVSYLAAEGLATDEIATIVDIDRPARPT